MTKHENSQRLTITVPAEIADAVRAKVASGEFDTAGDVLSTSFLHHFGDGRDVMLGLGDEAFDDLLRREVLPVLDALEADPGSGLSLEQVRASLAERRAQR